MKIAWRCNRLPQIKSLEIISVNSNNADLKFLLKCVAPSKLNEFWFKSKEGEYLDIKSYIKDIEKILEGTTDEAYFI